MPNAANRRRLNRSPELVSAATYDRVVDSPIASVWENVFDWEHLPWLHRQAFSSIECKDSGDWGWQAEIGFPGGERAEIELIADRDGGCYVSRTIAGPGSPGEIWTALDSVDALHTAVRVDFLVEAKPPDVLKRIGIAYQGLYAELWDQDAEMMQVRDRVDSKGHDPVPLDWQTSEGVDLGLWPELAPRLPLVVRFGGHRFRIVESAGNVLAHSAECPHWRGPLTDCVVDEGIVTCPWHGYRFEVASGRSADGRSMKLRPAPKVVIDSGSKRVRLVERGDGSRGQATP
jgi:nitrite reductase/ring-hydroxylating ferredoxin subunit